MAFPGLRAVPRQAEQKAHAGVEVQLAIWGEGVAQQKRKQKPQQGAMSKHTRPAMYSSGAWAGHALRMDSAPQQRPLL